MAFYHVALSTSESVKRIGMSEKDKAPTDNIPKDGDRGQDAALQERIEATVERALTKALNRGDYSAGSYQGSSKGKRR